MSNDQLTDLDPLNTSHEGFSEPASISKTHTGDTFFSTNSAKSTLTYSSITGQSTVFEQLFTAYRLANQSDIETLKTNILKTQNSHDPLHQYNIRDIFIERLTSLAPQEAVSFIEQSRRLDKIDSLSHVVTSWIRDDPEAALDYFHQINSMQLKRAIATRLLADPSLKASGLDNEIISSLGAYGKMIAEQVKQNNLDPSDAFILALQNNSNQRITQLHRAVTRWIRQDPETALTNINNFAEPEDLDQLLHIAITAYAKLDPQAALEYVYQNFQDDDNLTATALSYFAQQDPEAAMPRIYELYQRTGSPAALASAVTAWVQTDPSRTLAYIETLDIHSSSRLQVYRAAAQGYLLSQPVEAVAWLLSLGEEHQRVKQFGFSMVNQATVQALEAALGQLQSAKLKKSLLVKLSNFKSRNNGTETLKWLENYRREPGYNAAAQNVFINIAETNPTEAINLLLAVEDRHLATPIIGTIAQRWFGQNKDEAISGISLMPDGPIKNNAISALIDVVARRDPIAASDLIAQVSEAHLRNRATTRLANLWVQQSPQAVEEIVVGLALPIEQANQLRDLADQILSTGG